MKLKTNSVYLTHAKQPPRAILANCSPSVPLLVHPTAEGSKQAGFLQRQQKLSTTEHQRRANCRRRRCATRLIPALGSWVAPLVYYYHPGLLRAQRRMQVSSPSAAPAHPLSPSDSFPTPSSNWTNKTFILEQAHRSGPCYSIVPSTGR